MTIREALARASQWGERLVNGEKRSAAIEATDRHEAEILRRLHSLLTGPPIRDLDAEQHAAVRNLRVAIRDLRSSSIFPPVAADDEDE